MDAARSGWGLPHPSSFLLYPTQVLERKMVDLIPSTETVMQILKRTGAFRDGHFVYPNGKHSPYYLQMPLAFRYYDTARVLAVGLSRKFRIDRDISSQLPKVSIISRAPAASRWRSACVML